MEFAEDDNGEEEVEEEEEEGVMALEDVIDDGDGDDVLSNC